MTDKISVNVKMIDGKVFTLQVATGDKISKVKELLVEQTMIPANLQRLIYSGHVLDNEKTLFDYGICEGHSLHVIRSKPIANTQATSHGMETQRNLGTEQSMQSILNTNNLDGVMDSPLINSLLQNEDLIRSLIENHPQIQTLIENNPELGHILNDPATTIQMMQMMRNPNLMREMQRNTDRAISNLENHPEGFRVLRGLYQTLEEPLNRSMNNIIENFDENRSSESVPPSNETLTSPNTTALPNPWATPSLRATPPSGLGGPSRIFDAQNRPAATGDILQNLNTGGLDYMMGSMGGASQMDPEFIAQMMNNPIFKNMFQLIMSNPQLLQSLLNNQFAQDMLGRNSQLNDMMSNPEFLRMFSQINRGMSSTPTPNASGESTTGANTNQEPSTGANNWTNLNNVISQMLANNRFQNPFTAPSNAFQSAANDQLPPAERFADQLKQLKEMGFYDEAANINALSATNGNVNAAVDRLLNNL